MIRAIVICLLLAGCAHRDDGMGDYWKGVACVQEGKC
jgi:hypothetical protein